MSKSKTPTSVTKTTPKNSGLSPLRLKVLKLLQDAWPEELTRQDLRARTGTVKGWAKILGAPTKGAPEGDTLEGAGLIASRLNSEESRFILYTITPAGKKALAAAQSAAK